MADPVTTNIALIVPNTGADVGTWGAAALNPDFVAIDGFFGGVQTIGASNVNILLTSPAGFTPTPSGGPTQSQNGVLRFTGPLTGAVQVTLPLPGYIIVENLTTGAFVLSFRAIGSGQVIAVQQGSCRQIYNDGTNVRFVNLPDVGTYLDVAASVVPSWIAACTVPPYLLCDGSTFNASTFPFLNSFLGGNTLPDYRGRSAFYLNGSTSRLTSGGAGIDGTTLFASGGNNGLTLGAAQIPSLTSSGANTITVTSTVSGIPYNTIYSSAAGSGGNNVPFWTVQTNPIAIASQGNNSITVTYSNGSPSIVPSTIPGIVSGVRLIRAA